MHNTERFVREGNLLAGLAISLAMSVGAWGAQDAQVHSGPSATSVPAGQSGESSQEKRGSDLLPFQERRPRYRLAPGDGLELDFPFSPEFNQTVAIQPDGYITLRGIGDLYAQGKTVPDLRESLRAAYGKFLHDPVITVDVKDFQKPYFIVGGEVGHPGKFDLRDETTVTEAVAVAGGLTKDSKHSQVVLFRRVSDNTVEARKLNLKKMLASRDLREDVYLRPGDMLYVPKNKLSSISRFLPTSALSLYFHPLP